MPKCRFALKNCHVYFQPGKLYIRLKTMQSKIITYVAPIAVIALLGGCGGSSSSPSNSISTSQGTVGGTVDGLPAGVTVLLVNNGSDKISVNANGGFSINKKAQAQTAYDVTLFTQPTGANCAISNANGITDQNADAVTNITVTCQTAAVALFNYNIGVTVSGLAAGNSITFDINGANPLIVNTNGLAIFPETFAWEAAGTNNVSIATPPFRSHLHPDKPLRW